MKTECLGCRIASGEVELPGGFLYESSGFFSCHSVEPCLMAGSLFVMPRRHVESISDLTESESQELGPVIKKMSELLTKKLSAPKVYVCSFGEVLKHVHFHIVPRGAMLPANGPQVIQEIFAERKHVCDFPAAESVIRLLKS